MNRAKTILVHTSIYGAGQAMRGLSSFILLPVYTAYLTPADFGLIELLSIIVDLTALLIGSRVGMGIFKYYSEAGELVRKRQVVSTALILLFLMSSIGILALFLGSGALSSWLVAPAGFDVALRVFSISLLFNTVNEIFFAYLRIEDKPVAFVVLSVFKTLGLLALSIVFIVYMELGYWGVVWAILIASGSQTLIFSVWLLPSIGLRANWDYAGKLISYSVPILISSVGMYYVVFGDRYFLKYFHGLEAIGIYALAYKFGFTFYNLIWGPFATFWSAKQFEYAKEPDADKLFGNVFFYVNLMLLPAAVGVIVLTPHFIRLIAVESYWPAIQIVPWIVGAFILQCWTDYFRFGVLYVARTIHFAYGTFLTVALITVLYFYWIPREGPLGAAKATFFAFSLRFLYFFVVGRRFFDMTVPWRRLGLVSAYFLVICYTLMLWPMGDLWALAAKSALIAAAAIAVIGSPVIDKEHRDNVVHSIQRLFGSEPGE